MRDMLSSSVDKRNRKDRFAINVFIHNIIGIHGLLRLIEIYIMSHHTHFTLTLECYFYTRDLNLFQKFKQPCEYDFL